jgi:hypothetical protein
MFARLLSYCLLHINGDKLFFVEGKTQALQQVRVGDVTILNSALEVALWLCLLSYAFPSSLSWTHSPFACYSEAICWTLTSGKPKSGVAHIELHSICGNLCRPV